jgi:hypothetical protein
MTPSPCEHEGAVLAAVRAGEPDDALRLHLGACAPCAELAAVAGSLRTMAAALDGRPLPDPRRLYREAARQARQEAARRAARAVDLTRAVAVVAAVLTGALGAARLWPSLSRWWQGLDLAALAIRPAAFVQVAPALAGLVTVVALVVLSSLYCAWVEE